MDVVRRWAWCHGAVGKREGGREVRKEGGKEGGERGRRGEGERRP